MVYPQINGLVVCVNYADYFQYALPRWYPHLKSITVVTDLKDEHTHNLVRRFPGVKLHPTDIFYAKGAKFNKGAALEEARLALPPEKWSDWILFFDADVVPERSWYAKLAAQNLKTWKLYGAYRHQCEVMYGEQDIDNPAWRLIPDAPCDGGYFHLFHSSLFSQSQPLLETCWYHAGVYDSHFKNRFPHKDRDVLPIRLTHLGEQGRNWCGRGNNKDMDTLLIERRIRASYQQERV